jgi:hypothetical protein
MFRKIAVTSPINAPAMITTNAGTRRTARIRATNSGIKVQHELLKLDSSALSTGVGSKALVSTSIRDQINAKSASVFDHPHPAHFRCKRVGCGSIVPLPAVPASRP